MTAGILIVTWQSGAVIGACLDACRRFAPTCPVLVVDNASTDATRDKVRSRSWVRLIANADNRGFAAAVNQGFAALDTELVLVLNPDAELRTPVDPLIQSMTDPEVGASGGALADSDGRPQIGFQVRRFPTPAALAFEALGLNRLFPRNPVNRRYRALDHDPQCAADVEQPAGAFLMVRRTAWQAAGGFDERFFPAWFEDVDFLERLRAAGWRVRFEPAACAIHLGGQSFRSVPRTGRQIYWYRSLLRYAVLHFSTGGRAVVCGAVMAACIPRSIAGVWTARSAGSLIVYGKVLRLAAQVWVAGSKALDAGMNGRDAARTRRSLL